MTDLNSLFYGMTRVVKSLAVLGAVMSMVAIVLTGQTQVLLFTGFAVACAFYTEEVLSQRDVAVVRAESTARPATSH